MEQERETLRMRVSTEEPRSLEGVYWWRSSERYCDPVPVITLKQNVEVLYCIRALISTHSQHCSSERSYTYRFYFFTTRSEVRTAVISSKEMLQKRTGGLSFMKASIVLNLVK